MLVFNETKWSFFPNPAKNELFITGESKNEFPVELKLINAKGQEILSVPVTGLSQQIDLSQVPTGVYFLLLNDNNNQYSAKLVIKK